jgi:translation elongation factor EF-G
MNSCVNESTKFNGKLNKNVGGKGMSKTEKPHLNLVIMGHVDHGKSTTTGHLLILGWRCRRKNSKSNMKKKPKKWARKPSSLHGFSTT